MRKASKFLISCCNGLGFARGVKVKDLLLLVGAGQIGMAITRRVGFNHKIIIGDKNFDNAIAIADTLEGVGFDIVAT